MRATPEQLKARWETADGKQRLKVVVEAARRKEYWSAVLEGFPFVEEVRNGRDLRGACLVQADLGGAALKGASLIGADLSESNLVGADLIGADLRETRLYRSDVLYAHLRGADLSRAYLRRADFSGASLGEADLFRVDLSEAVLRQTDLTGSCIEGSDLTGSDLTGSDLRRTNLRGCLLVRTRLNGTDISEARVFGVSAWGVQLDGTKQSDLVITDHGEPRVTVDDIRVAQFIHLLLNNKNIRDVIDTITTKVVLILGRFTPKRKAVLDAIRQALRDKGYCPVLFDFTKPKSRDFMETVSTLAHMARFVVADFTAAKIVLEEVPHIVRNLAVPVQPLMKGNGREPVTLCNLRRNHRSLLATHRYRDEADLIENLDSRVIKPAEAMARELADR